MTKHGQKIHKNSLINFQKLLKFDEISPKTKKSSFLVSPFAPFDCYISRGVLKGGIKSAKITTKRKGGDKANFYSRRQNNKIAQKGQGKE
ncbi:MAG: hypothetical protein NC084_13360 [Bacteroides sp.]|nr:hypothetical protein [Bacteroides sp.]